MRKGKGERGRRKALRIERCVAGGDSRYNETQADSRGSRFRKAGLHNGKSP